MANIVECPLCACKLRVPDELQGDQVMCPKCGGTFDSGGGSPAPTAPVPPSASAHSAPAATETIPPLDLGPRQVVPPVPRLRVQVTMEEQGPPQPARHSPPRPLPPLDDDRTGGRGRPYDEDDDRPWENGARRDCEPHRGSLIMTFGILSVVLGVTCYLAIIGLPLGIAAWVMGQRDLRKMRAGVMDPFGRGSTQSGCICGIIGTVLNTLGLLWLIWMLSMAIMDWSRPSPTSPGGGAAPKLEVMTGLIPRLAAGLGPARADGLRHAPARGRPLNEIVFIPDTAPCSGSARPGRARRSRSACRRYRADCQPPGRRPRPRRS